SILSPPEIMSLRHGPLLILFVSCLLAACGNKENSILEADANGYLCSKCGEKFFTGHNSYADQCPKCGSANIDELVAFVCPVDTQTMIVPKSGKGAPCTKCGKFTNEKKLPSAGELTTWGARKVDGKKA